MPVYLELIHLLAEETNSAVKSNYFPIKKELKKKETRFYHCL